MASPRASPSHRTAWGPGGRGARPDTPNALPRAVVWGSQPPVWPHSPSPVPGCPPALTPSCSVAALGSVGLGKALKVGVPGGCLSFSPPHLGSGVICGGAPGAPPAVGGSLCSPAGLSPAVPSPPIPPCPTSLGTGGPGGVPVLRDTHSAWLRVAWGGPKWHPGVLARVGDPPVAPGVIRARGKVLVACGQAGCREKASLNRKAREAGP